jgi:hypothetical protein
MCDKHIPKMCVEGMQTLVSAMLISGAPQDKMPLKANGERHRGGYKHHPLTLWAAESHENWTWLWSHTHALCKEFEFRFGKRHAVAKQLSHLLSAFRWDDYVPLLDDEGDGQPVMFERCFNQSQGRNLDLLDTEAWPCDHAAYREFYRREKQTFAKWEKGRPAPSWWKEE